MRPEHSETKTKNETRECETEIETETSPVQSSQLHVKVTQVGMFYFFITHMR